MSFDPFIISRASDASWRFFGSVSGSTPKHEEDCPKLDFKESKKVDKKPCLMINWNLCWKEHVLIMGGEDYIESHPVAEAARHLFYGPGGSFWMFSHVQK